MLLGDSAAAGSTVVAAGSGRQAIMNSPTHFPDYDARRMRSA
jgi:hypothetical protein